VIKRLGVFMVTLVLLLAAAGVAGVHAEKVVLRVAIADTGKTPADELDKIVERFEAERPDIDVEIEQDYGGDFDKLATHVIGGTAPDIFHAFNEVPVLAMRNNFCLNLSPYIEKDDMGDLISDLLPAVLDQMSQDGSIYGLPFQTSAVGTIYCNPQMFAESGMILPDGSWGWDEFGQTCRKLTEFDGERVVRSGYQQYTAWLWYFPWFVQSGVEFDDETEVPLGSAEAIRAVEFLYEWIERGNISWGWGAFPAQTSAMTFSGSWELKYWVDSNVPMGIAPVPSGPAGKATLTNTNVIAIISQSRHPDEAWDFLKWFYGVDVQRQYMEMFGMQPVLLSLGYEWTDALEEFYSSHGASKVTGLENFITGSAFAMPQPFFSNAAVISQYIQPAMDQIMTGNKPASSTLKSMSEAATRFLQEGN